MDQERLTQGLNEAELDRFNEDGFVVVDDLFSMEEVNTLRQACSAPEDQQWEKSDRLIHALELTVRHQAFLDLARDPRIVSRLQSLIGADIQLQHSKLAAQPVQRQKGGFRWHQDFAFFPHTNTDLVAVMVMLDDATQDNGCMHMIRGSHKLGLLDHMDEDGLFTGGCKESSVWEDHPERIAPVMPKAGGISIHHCLSLHSSGPNPSGAPRRGLVFQYRADDAVQLADGVWQDTGVMVCGQRRERARCDAGVLRLPKSRRYPAHPFGHAWNQEGSFAAAVNKANGFAPLRAEGQADG
ncbi:MAG: phytanoyl-CoA dioxygenase family protein [Candidatus Latescibacteria bacterium]|nr:phytanoyl-CoA dioxygenase family protein [Candidatus Latescibacterota bacterium]